MRKSVCYLLAIISIALVTQGCQKELGPEEKCNFVQNSQSRRVSWFRFPIKFYIDKQSVDDTTMQAVQLAMASWNAKFSSPVFELLGRTSQLPQPGPDGEPPRDSYNAIYIIEDGRNFKPNEQARTSLHHRGDFIHEADIAINGTLDFYLGDKSLEKSERKIELESLLIHELGHVLGLDHINDEPSVMAAKLDYGQVRKDIQDAELDALTCEYQ